MSKHGVESPGRRQRVGPVTLSSALGAAVASIVVWVITLTTGVEVDPEIQGAFTVILTIIGGWVIPSNTTKNHLSKHYTPSNE